MKQLLTAILSVFLAANAALYCEGAAGAARARSAADGAKRRQTQDSKNRRGGNAEGAGSRSGGKSSRGIIGEAPAKPRSNDGRAENADARVTAATYGPKRTKPVFTGEFAVDLVIVAFPDCVKPDAAAVQKDLDSYKGYSVADYYKEYSQGITWPKLQVFGDVYAAPQPIGYYCRHNPHTNPVGFEDAAEGNRRADRLRADALAFARRSSRAARPGKVVCYVYCNKPDRESIKVLMAPHFPKPADWEPRDGEPTEKYDPKIPWGDPMWPNSTVQVLHPGDGGTIIHELGHVLGAPDFYHATEEHDGVKGTPSLPWSYGPTGPAYCRYIYQAFVPKETYPVLAAPGVYTLDPRASKIPAAGSGTPKPVLGCFIPSSHPNYIFCLEYAFNEKPPVGNPSMEGLVVSVINVKMSSPHMGPPDICYTYRSGDRYMKGRGDGRVCLREGDSFTSDSDPAALIPPLIPAGIEITDIREADGRCTFNLAFPKTDRSAKYLREALLPKILLSGVDDVMPRSMHPRCEVVYRGEPHLSEYGFVWDTSRNPTVAKNRYPLYHRDRRDAQIYGLRPETKYYVRAYAKSELGTVYSSEEIEVTTPDAAEEAPPLLVDRLSGNFFITRWHFGNDEEGYMNSANSIIALMSLGVYYGTVPGASRKSNPMDVRRVHTNPSESRPKFRLAEFDELYRRMDRLTEICGLREHGFGNNMAQWQKKCAKGLGIDRPAEAFVHTPDVSSLEAARRRINDSILDSKPVLLIRENNYMPGVTNTKYPLDIAILDGVDDSGEWHVVFPLGCDRGDKKTKSGYIAPERLMLSVVDACLLFYSPLDK